LWYTQTMRDARQWWLGIVAIAFACGGDGSSDSARPNFLILIADDQTAATFGAAGDPVAQTPRLDSLATEGVRFSNAFVTTSICSPARASYLTGQYVRRHGVSGNPNPLPRDAVSFASKLRAAGYDTAYVGKWHMGDVAEPRPGFAWTASFAGQGRYEDCEFWVGDRLRETRGNVDEVSTGFAIEFLRRPRHAPFLMVVGYKGLHVPRSVPERFEPLYQDASIAMPVNSRALAPYPRRTEHAALRENGAPPLGKAGFAIAEDWAARFDRGAYDVPRARQLETARKYYRSLTALDDAVGRLLDELDHRDLADNTVVVYVGDNGTHLFAHGMVGKRSAYEESMRVEMLVRDPGVPSARGARTLDELILNIDLAPTLLDRAGVPIPATMQGRSWLPLLEGAVSDWRDAFVYEYYSGRFPFLPTMLAVRTRDAKLVTYPGYPSWTQLFDLARDPAERTDLASEPERAAQRRALHERLAALEAEIGPRLE